MAARKKAGPKPAPKFAVVRMYGGKVHNIVAGTATLAAAKTAAARELFRYSDYDYAVYELVGQVKPVVPEITFIAIQDDGDGQVSS